MRNFVVISISCLLQPRRFPYCSAAGHTDCFCENEVIELPELLTGVDTFAATPIHLGPPNIPVQRRGKRRPLQPVVRQTVFYWRS